MFLARITTDLYIESAPLCLPAIASSVVPATQKPVPEASLLCTPLLHLTGGSAGDGNLMAHLGCATDTI